MQSALGNSTSVGGATDLRRPVRSATGGQCSRNRTCDLFPKNIPCSMRCTLYVRCQLYMFKHDLVRKPLDERSSLRMVNHKQFSLQWFADTICLAPLPKQFTPEGVSNTYENSPSPVLRKILVCHDRCRGGFSSFMGQLWSAFAICIGPSRVSRASCGTRTQVCFTCDPREADLMPHRKNKNSDPRDFIRKTDNISGISHAILACVYTTNSETSWIDVVAESIEPWASNWNDDNQLQDFSKMTDSQIVEILCVKVLQ